ncbi:hypothetical protein C8A01DRAFT_35431 [Parachaetomium inaequale]|uniref:Uncharacterized protein n=1 Tax=Parachaetomium inaequale TaxID=2588326 RepID=A0AAN6SSM7_9PEZI|nr:hypothetical protein C8A01DRAFT_35431 [Parachaetomium inaequale]
MRGLLSRVAVFTQLRKRADAKRTPDAASPLPLPAPVPDGSTPEPGSAHLDPSPQQRDGAADGPVEGAVAAETANSPPNNSTNTVAAPAITLEALPAEQYLLDRKALLRTGLKAALGNSVVDAYAVQTSASLYGPVDSRHELQLETITLFIDNYVALRSPTPDVILEECCTEEDLLGMAAFCDSVARPLSQECATRFLGRLDNTSVDVANNLSATELTRLLRALYRYQLYCNLFGQGPDGYYRKVPRVEIGHHLDLFFCIFKPWEIEEIYCIYILLRNTYSDVLDTIAWDLNRDHPKFKDWPNPLAPGSWDLEIHFEALALLYFPSLHIV